MLPEWPGWDELTEVEQLTVNPRGGGAGFDDPFSNAVVEAAAMGAVQQFYSEGGWHVADVSGDGLGWDLTCTSPDGDVVRVEVKGVRGDDPHVLLTANELRAAREDCDWWLAVVTRALSKPEVHEFDAPTAITAAKPYVYRADLSVGPTWHDAAH